MASTTDLAAGQVPLLQGFQSNTAALSTTTASAGQLSGSAVCIMINTGSNPGTYTTRAATAMIADSNLQVGQTYLVFLANNQATGTLTLAAGSGVTVSGTATVAANVARWFVVTVNTAAAMTFAGVVLSHICAV